MWDVLWTVVVVAMLTGVGLLFIVDALKERTVLARLAALMLPVAGIVAGAELWTPWLPLGMVLAAVALARAGTVRRGPG